MSKTKKIMKKALHSIGFKVSRVPPLLKEKSLNEQSLKTIKIGKYKLVANENHAIEEYLNRYPHYARNIARIAKIIESKYPHFKIIDIGANIGDTIALIRSEGVSQETHCIEGEPRYFEILRQNQIKFENVFSYNIFLGESSKISNINTATTEGTSRIIEVDKRNLMNVQSKSDPKMMRLDDFIQKYSIDNIKLLKIDTDGYDFKIIRSGLKCISNQKPIIFMEYSNYHLTANKEDGIDTLTKLEKLGYNKIIYYDNCGRFLLATELDKVSLLKHLYNYTANKEGAITYYDLCIVHSEDNQLADLIIQKEENMFHFKK